MADKRANATVIQVKKEIAPFVKKHLFGRDTVDAKHIRQIVVMLLKRYDNVSITQGLNQGKGGTLWLKITIKTFLRNEDILLEITGTLNGK